MTVRTALVFVLAAGLAVPAAAQQDDAVKTIVERLDLEHYKATIKGLTAFGDRREGTDRNRAAIDWIEAQLKSYGCPTERLRYEFQPRPAAAAPAPGGTAAAGAAGGNATRPASGGGRYRGTRNPTSVNTDPSRQPDEKLRALNSQPSSGAGQREQVYCTKVGTTRPDEMYIVSAHMDGHGWGEAANDNGSGTAIVMELARILNSPDVPTDRTIRFILWNNEETGLNGSAAYAAQRKDLQGKEEPLGSRRYPEPRWLGVIQHDMMLFDHGMPRADGTLSPEQRPEADVNVEFQVNSKMAAQSQALAWVLQVANEKYAHGLPGVGRQPHDEYRLGVVSGSRRVDFGPRERARNADRLGLGSALAPAHRSLHHVFGQGLQAGPQRRADDARRSCAAGRCDAGRATLKASHSGRPLAGCERRGREAIDRCRLKEWDEGVGGIIVSTPTVRPPTCRESGETPPCPPGGSRAIRRRVEAETSPSKVAARHSARHAAT